MKKPTVCAFVLVAAASSLHADSLEDKQYWKGQLDYVNASLAKAEKGCDAKFAFDWVGKDKLRDETKPHGGSPNGVCTSIIDEVANLCSTGPDAKSAVKAKIKGFRCGFGKPRTLDLKAGTVTYMGNNQEVNFSDWAKPWLMKNL